MANNTSSSILDKWREFFRTANSDIFDIIKNAIMVAASDCPYDFKLNRDQIAELLFSCKSTKCFGCDKIELSLPNHDVEKSSVDNNDDKYKSGVESKDAKESKANSYDVEALTDEIEEESQMFDEVLRIKETLDNHENEYEDALFDSLRRLQLMPLSLETLKATEIGKTVNGLRKHGSKDIRNLVRTLIEDWKNMVDEFYSATAAIAGEEVTPESGKKSVVEEEEGGLPSPPFDEGAFFTAPNAMELSQFFDGMDDDGNLRNSGEFNKNRHSNGRRPSILKTENAQRKQDTVFKQTPPCKPNKLNGVETVPGRPKPVNGESGPGRPKPSVQSKGNNEIKVHQKSDKGSIQKKPSPPEKSNCNNEDSVRLKLEAAKRKLHERYQEAENAKKQRTIQIVDLQDLSKQSVAHKNTRPGNHNRHWANNRT